MRDSAPSIPRHLLHHPQPRAPAGAPEDEPSDAAERHLHRIAVETGPEPVFVTIGRRATGEPDASEVAGHSTLPALPQAGGSSHAPIPGGFAKLFNRVIDSGAWGFLPDPARAVYVPMVRFAEGRDGFRVRIGLAALMKYTRLSRSSVKRALRALLEARLVAIVRAGGVAPDGTNRTNVYQLLLPELESDDLWPAGSHTPPGMDATSGRATARHRPFAPPPDGRERHVKSAPASSREAPAQQRQPQSAARAKRGALRDRAVIGASGATRTASSREGSATHCEEDLPVQRPVPGDRRAPAPVCAPGGAPGGVGESLQDPYEMLGASAISNLQSQIAISVSSWADAAGSFAGVPADASGLPPGSRLNPRSAPAWPPAPALCEPPFGPGLVPAVCRAANPAGGSLPDGTGTGQEPPQRVHTSALNTEAAAGPLQLPDAMHGEPGDTLADSDGSPGMAALLRAWNLAPAVAAELAREYSAPEIRAAVAMARQAKARGRLRNPAGYIVRCLEEAWAGARLTGGAAPGAEAGITRSGEAAAGREVRRVEEGRALASREVADARLDELDDETISHLANRVLAMHADRPAMLRLLSARPPRESRLMRAEIAALLEV